MPVFCLKSLRRFFRLAWYRSLLSIQTLLCHYVTHIGFGPGYVGALLAECVSFSSYPYAGLMQSKKVEEPASHEVDRWTPSAQQYIVGWKSKRKKIILNSKTFAQICKGEKKKAETNTIDRFPNMGNSKTEWYLDTKKIGVPEGK